MTTRAVDLIRIQAKRCISFRRNGSLFKCMCKDNSKQAYMHRFRCRCQIQNKCFLTAIYIERLLIALHAVLTLELLDFHHPLSLHIIQQIFAFFMCVFIYEFVFSFSLSIDVSRFVAGGNFNGFKRSSM